MQNKEFNDKLIRSLSELQQYTRCFTTNHDEADDLFQETLLKALRSYGHYYNDKNFNGWFYTIMHNTFINNKCKRKEFSSETQPEIYGEIYFDDKPDYRELTTLVRSMPKKYSLPLMLYANGYKYHEIAVKLGLSIGTVKSRIHTARTQLKEKLHQEGWA